ncbi:MAG: VOC family protein [Gammaproteobacteria bacterium]|jgi:catechol 2,3-dioxygenase-like lactoylglutathione lyase family enzyme|nr:VOC family protein [Gammaproteobacteria bacterium]
MKLQGINHLAFITDDMVTTIRFYRDLLGLKLSAGIGHDGYRHYFFQFPDGATHVAFFEYAGATVMNRKFPGNRTSLPLGFDHVSFTVNSREDLFALKDRLEAADIEVEGAIDHGIFWSVYFYDPHNNIPLEATWQFMDIEQYPAISEDDPLEIVAEGADPQPGHWPVVERVTPQAEMCAEGGNGHPMRQHFIKNGLARFSAGVSAEFQRSLQSDVED